MPVNAPDFSQILTTLVEANVDFVLVGGLAMVSHGCAHITQDIDIGYALGVGNAQALVAALKPYHPFLRGVPRDLPFIFDAQMLRNTQNLTLDTDLGPMDLLGHLAGIDSFQGLQERAVTLELFGQSIHVASIDDLIAMKRAANRPKDQNHLLELYALKKLIEEQT